MPPHSPRDQHPDEVEQLAALLSRLRNASGMTRVALGAKLLHSSSAMSRYLKGTEVLPKESLEPFLNETEASSEDRQRARYLMGVITGAITPLPPTPPTASDSQPDVTSDQPDPPVHPPTAGLSTAPPPTASSTTTAQPLVDTAQLAPPPEFAAGQPAPRDQGNNRAENPGAQAQDETTSPTAGGQPSTGSSATPQSTPRLPAVSTVISLHRPSRPDRRRTILIAAGVVGLVAIIVAVTTLAIDLLRGPQRQCAIVDTPKKTPAPVYLTIGQERLKEKRYGERVEIYPVLEPTDTPDGKYLPVFLREDGRNTYGWMLERQLKPVACSP